MPRLALKQNSQYTARQRSQVRALQTRARENLARQRAAESIRKAKETAARGWKAWKPTPNGKRRMQRN